LAFLEREQYLNEHFSQYQDSLREQISITARLTNENNEIRQRLEEYNETLSSVNRLHDEIKTKDLLIQKLQTEIDCKTHQIVEYSEDLQTTDNTRVEKQLVKHIILSYFNTPIDKKQEVIPILGALLGFTQEEYQKAMNALSNNYNNSTGTNWLTGWLSAHPVSTQSDNPVYHPDKVSGGKSFLIFQRFFDFSHLLNY
jgi:chromosome segregation ATPase